MSQNLLKKISTKNVCGEVKAPEVGKMAELMVVMGYAKSYEKKATTFGDSTGFHGDFKAIDAATGEVFRSSTCYLPDVASDMLENALDANKGVVEFGFSISVIGVKGRTDADTNKYEYRCKPLMDTAENDPLLELEDKLAKKTSAAPKKATK